MSTARGSTGFASSDEGIRVLLVDDEPGFAEVAAELLERQADAITTVTETTASAGLDRLGDEEVDAVISDYDMPGMDGLELLREVRAMGADLPFILFTGKGSEEVASDAISAGVTDYLQKGSGTDRYAMLANRIENAVERYRAEQTVRDAFRAIEAAREGISILDEDGHFRYVNGTYADLYGYDPDELVGEHWERLYRDEDVAEIRREVLPQVRDDGGWRGQTVGLRSDGTVFREDHSLAETDSGGLVCVVRELGEGGGTE